GNQHVRPFVQNQPEGFMALTRQACYADISFGFKQRRQRAEDHFLIFGNQHAYLLRCHDTASSGKVMRRRVPRSSCLYSAPPRASTRSRIPRSPSPSVAEAPRPSSYTSRLQTPSAADKRSRHLRACEWRTTFNTASRRASASTFSSVAGTCRSAQSVSTSIPA